MKVSKFFAMFAACAMLAVACEKPVEPTPTPDPKPDPDPTPVVLNTEANLISLTAVIDGEDVKGTIYKNDKVVEFVYLPEAEAAYRAATLKVVVSDGATTNIKADQAYDLVSFVDLTITSEDGKTTNKFSVEAVPAQVTVKCEPVWDGGFKTAGQANLSYVSSTGGSVAFCGVDKFVYLDGTVCDLDCNVVGELNMDGTLAGGTLYSIDNDVNGVVIGQIRTEDAATESVTACEFYAWKDGYDKAPVKFLEVTDVPFTTSGFRFMSVGGDVNGSFILCAITGGRGATTMHHVYHFANGISGEAAWYAFNTPYVSNDGCWAQMVSPASGDINGMFFIADSEGSNRGYHIYARQGLMNDDVVLYGTVWTDGLADRPAEGDEENHEYGNFSLGSCKGFQYSGTDYVASFTTGWPCGYLTIQTANPDDEEHYLLRTQVFDGCAQAGPSGAYIYNPATDKGYVVMVLGEYSAGTPYGTALYEISREIF